MLEALITSRTRRKILALFCLNPTRKFYLRQIAREIGEGVNSARQELSHLESAGVLLSQMDGRHKFFALNESMPGIEPLKNLVKTTIEKDSKEFIFTNFDRKERLEKNLSKVVSALRLKYHPEKIILFGSLADGKVGPWSDIDLLIIKETNKRYFDRVKDVVSICDYDVGIDFLIWTPEELEDEADDNLFIREEVLKRGKVIYEKRD